MKDTRYFESVLMRATHALWSSKDKFSYPKAHLTWLLGQAFLDLVYK